MLRTSFVGCSLIFYYYTRFCIRPHFQLPHRILQPNLRQYGLRAAMPIKVHGMAISGNVFPVLGAHAACARDNAP